MKKKETRLFKDCFYCGKQSDPKIINCPFCGRSKRETPKERGFEMKTLSSYLFKLTLLCAVMSIIIILVINYGRKP